MILATASFYALLALQTHKSPAPRVSSRAEVASVRRFAQTFYDWYTPKALQENVDAEHLALTQKGPLFSPELRRALMDDWQAQHAKGVVDIVGIDWDPFLGGQDPADRYWVEKISQKGRTWRVSVWSAYGKQSHKPDVIAIVEKSKVTQRWQFTNFEYGDSFDLLKSLRQLKKDREG